MLPARIIIRLPLLFRPKLSVPLHTHAISVLGLQPFQPQEGGQPQQPRVFPVQSRTPNRGISNVRPFLIINRSFSLKKSKYHNITYAGHKYSTGDDDNNTADIGDKENIQRLIIEKLIDQLQTGNGSLIALSLVVVGLYLATRSQKMQDGVLKMLDGYKEGLCSFIIDIINLVGS